MPQSRPSFSRAKPRFSRRFLWILIFLLLLLIPLLSRLGPDEVTGLPDREQVSDVVEVAGLTPVTELRGNVATVRAALPAAPVFRVTVLSAIQPLELEPLTEPLRGESFYRYGLWGLTLRAPYEATALADLADYLQFNLPPATPATRYVFSGPWSDESIGEVAGAMILSEAPSGDARPRPEAAVKTFAMPAPDAAAFWRFVLAMDLLDQRLVESTVELDWDQRVRPPRVYLSASLLPRHRTVPSEEAFVQARGRLARAVGAERLNVSAVHEHLVHMAAFDLPPSWLAGRLDAVQTLTYESFSEYWETLFAPTSPQ